MNWNGTNQTFTPNSTFTFNESLINLTIYASDILNNWNYSCVQFLIIAPFNINIDDYGKEWIKFTFKGGLNVQIDISKDNASWTDITSTSYAGKIDETNKSAYVFMLKEETPYYFRSKDTATSWIYFKQYTSGYIPEVISIILSVIVMVFAFLFVKEADKYEE